MKLRRRGTRRYGAVVAAVAGLLAVASPAFAQGVRVGETFAVKPPAERAMNPGYPEIRRFTSVAYDADNNKYLVAWGNFQIGARFVAADGTLEGTPVVLNEDHKSEARSASTSRVACGAGINTCLVTWIEELPSSVICGRLVRYNAGNVQFLTDPFVVNQNGFPKFTESAPGVAYSPAASEFLVAWAEYSREGRPDVKAQRVTVAGSPTGSTIPIAETNLWEGYPSLTYNSVQNEYVVAYYYETDSGTNAVAVQRIQPGTGALIGGRSTLISSLFDGYPEVAYDSTRNQYLAISWHVLADGTWLLNGRFTDGNGEPLGSGAIPLAARGGGSSGSGIAYNPVSDTYFCVYQSQTNDEVWGVIVSSSGLPGYQFQVTFSGTRLAVNMRTAASSNADRWLAVASENYARVMGQLVEQGTVQPPSPPPPPSPIACTTPQPGADWTCDTTTGNWLPPAGSGTGGGTTGCPTIQPAPDWTCVNGNWLPPGVGAGSACPGTAPAPSWVCLNGNWLPPNHPLLIGG